MRTVATAAGGAVVVGLGAGVLVYYTSPLVGMLAAVPFIFLVIAGMNRVDKDS